MIKNNYFGILINCSDIISSRSKFKHFEDSYIHNIFIISNLSSNKFEAPIIINF